MFIVIGILIISQLLGSIYSGGLASVMTIQQHEKSIDTVEELANSEMKWGATHDAWIFSILLTTQVKDQNCLKILVVLMIIHLISANINEIISEF